MCEQSQRFFDEYFCGNREAILKKARNDSSAMEHIRPVLLTKDLVTAMETLAKYDWDSELWDFLSTEEDRQANHVFVSKLILLDWLEHQPDYWVKKSSAMRSLFVMILLVFFMPEIIWLSRQIIESW